jgi:hypothetical protein
VSRAEAASRTRRTSARSSCPASSSWTCTRTSCAGHAHPDVRQPAQGRRQGRMEPGARRQGADDRRPDVHELHEGNLSRQRHQGRVHQRRPSEVPRTGSSPTK